MNSHCKNSKKKAITDKLKRKTAFLSLFKEYFVPLQPKKRTSLLSYDEKDIYHHGFGLPAVVSLHTEPTAHADDQRGT
jgi:hypothetical protein